MLRARVRGGEQIRLRKRITLARLSAVPPIVGVTFAVGTWAHAPWQVSLVNAGLFVLPVFISDATLTQWLVFYGVAGILVGLMAPPVRSHCGSRTGTRPSVLPSGVAPKPGGPLARLVPQVMSGLAGSTGLFSERTLRAGSSPPRSRGSPPSS
jgi:hypothetical protein